MFETNINIGPQYQLLYQHVIDLEERIIQLEQDQVHLEQCYMISLQTNSKGINKPPIIDYKPIMGQQKIAIRKLEVEYQLAVKKLEFASLTM